ncbi:MAG TPA: amidohydrolase family protein, partial [Acidimicrobiales bacterium]|nr:amidohydrolase family protein [Acidimicrobiales bacterium]
MPDLVLRGGTVVDGTGAPRRRADVAVSGGRVVEVGRIGGAGREVDVTGLVVAPGFVDLHTHYDAQIHWDPTMSPSGLHGVTTIIGGNCGFTVAPMREEHAEYLIKMLAKVEGMPLAALESGIAFEWGSFGEWLDHLEARGMALNAGFLVGHSTIRRLVMGEGTSNPATEAQVTAMAALLAESLAAGGLGFSSSWSSTHLDGENNPVPSRFADASELVALARVAGSHEGTTLEFIPGLIPFGPKEAGVMIDMSLAANRTINWNLVRVNTPDTTIAESALAHSDDAAKRGAAIVGLINPEPNQSQFNLAVGKLFELLPGWRETMVLPLPERMAAFRDPTVRERLFDCTRSVTAEPMVQLCRWGELIISQTFSEENRPFEGRTVGEVAS